MRPFFRGVAAGFTGYYLACEFDPTITALDILEIRSLEALIVSLFVGFTLMVFDWLKANVRGFGWL